MKFGFPGGPRLEWYDRNPALQAIAYVIDNVSPHAETLRASYTVPTGKKAWVQTEDVFLRRRTAPTTAGLVFGKIVVVNVHLMEAAFNSAIVDTIATKDLAPQMLLQAGQSIGIYTADASTGGAIDYYITGQITEFNA